MDMRQMRWRIGGGLLVLLTLFICGGWFFFPGGPTPESIAEGRSLFEHTWVSNDPRAGGDGLGPVYNAQSCVACHFQGGVGGGGSNQHNVTAFEVLPRPDDPQMHGGVVHAFATRTELLETQKTVGKLFPLVHFDSVVIEGCRRGPRDFDPVQFATINTPPLFGLGLIDGMTGYSIHMDGVRRGWTQTVRALKNKFDEIPVGRIRRLPNNRIGRFGWKGQFATLKDFVAAACAVELGLSNPLRSQDQPQHHVPDADAKWDLDHAQLQALVDFVRSLPRPQQVLPDDARARQEAIQGEALFAEIGCASCHTPDMGGVQGVYSDFRLYALSRATYDDTPLDDNLPLDVPKQEEWKTPPLWGVADSAPYFHDGVCRTLRDAILRHDGQARRVKAAFQSLALARQQQVIAFLKTLRAPSAETLAAVGATASKR